MQRQLAFLMFSIAAPGRAAMTPSQPRVDYVRTIPSVKEFTKPRNVFVKFVNLVAGAPEGRPEIVRPYATALDNTGRLLVADPGQQGVHIYDFEKRKYDFLRGPKGRRLVSPVGIACDAGGNIYVSDSALAAVYVFDSRGRLVRYIGANGWLKRPTALLVDSESKRLYLADTLRHEVIVLGLDGTVIRTIGKRGTDPGEFNYPTALALTGNRIYVVDSMNFRIQAFSTEGNYLSTFGRPGVQTGTLNRPKGIAADTDGHLYVVDALFETVQVFDPSGTLLYYFGSGGTKDGQFQLPSGITIDGRNHIYVADSMNHRVQVFRYQKQAGWTE